MTSPLITENSGLNAFSRIYIIVFFCIRVMLYFGNGEFKTRSFRNISKEFDWNQISEMTLFTFDAIVYILSLYIASHNFSNLNV